MSAGTTSATGTAANGGGRDPGAHGFVDTTRWWNVKHPNAYAQALADGRLPVADSESLDAEARHTEEVMLRLRLRSGLPVGVLGRGEAERAQIAVADGLVDRRDDRLVLTDRGRLAGRRRGAGSARLTPQASDQACVCSARGTSMSYTRACSTGRLRSAARTAWCTPSSR